MREVLDTYTPEAAVRYSGSRATLVARRSLAMRQSDEERIRLIRFLERSGSAPSDASGVN
jgi:hypothetical protein